jgi:hypothetical protein
VPTHAVDRSAATAPDVLHGGDVVRVVPPVPPPGPVLHRETKPSLEPGVEDREQLGAFTGEELAGLGSSHLLVAAADQVPQVECRSLLDVCAVYQVQGTRRHEGECGVDLAGTQIQQVETGECRTFTLSMLTATMSVAVFVSGFGSRPFAASPSRSNSPPVNLPGVQ